ncbi:MAG TPA: hypothetical protein VGH28_33285 [Polyangiaceae bacterium]
MVILRGGYDKKSLVLVAAVAAIAVASGVVWRDYVSFAPEDFDPLLVFCWLLMVVLAAFRFSPRRDLPLAAVAFVGGALIETWGTRSGLWTYFTHEKPPLFILPAWPVAALATERVARAARRLAARIPDRAMRAIHAVTLIAFCTLLWTWTAPGRSHPTTAVAYALVAITCVSGRTPREDVLRFVAGSLLGWLLEYWGTTRFCWTYWDEMTPPLAAVLSHGFATVAFARGVAIASALAALPAKLRERVSDG